MPSKLYRKIQRVGQGPAVRAELARVAEQLAADAEAIAAEEQVANPGISVEHGTRPEGRAYSRVKMDHGEHEYGREYVPAKRILGRAAARQ